MVAESYFTENITSLIVYLAVAFFLFGLWLGWILWGKGRSRGFDSVWYCGHPHLETSIAPMLNPAAYSNIKFRSKRITPVQDEVVTKSKGQDSEEGNEASEAEIVNADLPVAWRGLSDDVSAGKARVDDSLGLVYSEPPEHEDDLTAIKGVAKVLNGKLNNFGVYTYRQIAGWTDPIIAEFSTRLSFKDRVKRDDWIGQAKALHREQYGEDL